MNQMSGEEERKKGTCEFERGKKDVSTTTRPRSIYCCIDFRVVLILSRFNTSYRCNVINGSDFFFEKGGGDKLPHSVRV